MKRLCPFEGYFIISMPGHTVPVRRAGAIVAIRTRQAAVSTVIQVATAPRGVHARRTGRIERSHTPLHCSKNNRLVAMVNHRHKRGKSSTGVSGGYTPSMCLRHIPHWLAEEFRTYCSRLYGLTPDDRVFYMTCTALNKELTRCTQLTYLPDIRVHDLRHSHVSLCIELGYSVVLVARRIGDTVPVVMRTYAHLYPNKQQELVSKLEAIGSPTSNNDDSNLMSLG